LADVADDGLNGDSLSFPCKDFEERAFEKALNFKKRFISFNLKKNVALGDGIAFSLAPLDDRADFFRLS
jgi:hypothetical protein